MAFWRENDVKPVRKFRFTVGDNETWWWAKSVDKPTFDINISEYQLANVKFKFPGLLSWNDVVITIVDSGDKAKNILDDIMKRSGWNNSKLSKTTYNAISKEAGWGGQDIKFFQFDHEGKKPIEEWTLKNTIVKSVNFGDVAYESDDFVEIQITISYDYAILE